MLLAQLVIFLYVILLCLTIYCSEILHLYVALYSAVYVYRSVHHCMGDIFLSLYLSSYL